LHGDFALVGLAASIENLAVATYQAGIDAASAGQLGAVPAVVIALVETAQRQHRDHADAWNALLTDSGKTRVVGVDMALKTSVVDPAWARVKDAPGLARLALDLESIAAATYLRSIGIIQNSRAVMTAASIQPVEMQHIALLNFVLGRRPVPDSFANGDAARTSEDAIAGF
jgi:poly-gamma-glutamate capsule biosynthesis protein CapA/YwtB (metallophosphatase superfamily)